MMREFIRLAFNRHEDKLHNADFEVCRVWYCRLARWLEVRLTTKNSQTTTNVSQATAELNQEIATLDRCIDRLECIYQLATELKQCAKECDKLRADIAGLLNELAEERQQRIEANAHMLATAHALGLDMGDVGELPQKAANLLEVMKAAERGWTQSLEINDMLVRELIAIKIVLEETQSAARWLWGFWDGNTLMASPGADREALDEAWDRLLKVLQTGEVNDEEKESWKRD